MLQSLDTLPVRPLAPDRSHDYDLVRRAIRFLSEQWTEQPDLDRLARHLGLSPAHCQKLFKRWCGLSPKEFVQAITVDHARSLLGNSASILEAAHEVGLSGGSRLHDLFVDHEAMTPGDYKRRGEGLDIAYGFHDSPFGEVLILATDRCDRLDDPWRDRAIFRQVEIDQPLPLVDFDGSATTHRAFAARYRVSLTPTVVVVDRAGRIVGGPVVGLLTADFYASYLESAIDAGRKKLGGSG